MICVSIGRGRHKHMIAEHKHLVEQGAKLVELRLDHINGEINLKRVLPERPGPVVVTIRRPEDGGKFERSEDERRILLRSAIVSGAEYVDLEEDAAAAIPRYGKTKRIVSLHDFRKTPDNLEEIHARLAALDADIVKIATLATHPQDCLRMLRLMRDSKIPTIGLCMGDIGVPTRILAGKLGAPFSYATFSSERALAPGQLSYRDMTDIYHYEQINAETAVYGVMGDPIGHSLSPLIHNASFAALGLNAVYIPFRIPREDVVSFLTEAQELGVRGLSVTIPHKEAVQAQLTRADDAVRGIGAANTIVFSGNDSFGHNTDHQASMASLAHALGVPADSSFSLKGKKALVLGAGGAAKAIAFGLKEHQAEVVLASRTRDRTNRLAAQLECKAIDWDSRYEIDPDLLMNCTPVGMHPNVDSTPFDRESLRSSMVVFDAVYNPENTLLVKEARSRGCKVVSGLDMFVRQAALQFQYFTGQPGPADLMREVLKRAIGAART
jgi:3-dehydroquinate dehydratase/shikimate dehydrogenase